MKKLHHIYSRSENTHSIIDKNFLISSKLSYPAFYLFINLFCLGTNWLEVSEMRQEDLYFNLCELERKGYIKFLSNISSGHLTLVIAEDPDMLDKKISDLREISPALEVIGVPDTVRSKDFY